MAVEWPAGREFSGDARNGVGFRSLLCRDHGGELEIPVCPADRFFDCDYGVFDDGGMGDSEDQLNFGW